MDAQVHFCEKNSLTAKLICHASRPKAWHLCKNQIIAGILPL